MKTYLMSNKKNIPFPLSVRFRKNFNFYFFEKVTKIIFYQK